MGQIVEIARSLREDHDFRGYIHLKTIPDADGQLLADAGRYADRLSINVELPTAQALQTLAPEKDLHTIKLSMARIRVRRDEAEENREQALRAGKKKLARKAPRFAPAGQSTQMIIGAEPTNDARILQTSAQLYSAYSLKRVYYSAFSPIPDAPSTLTQQQAPLLREHRLYQSDWLMRFYGFDHAEVTAPGGDRAGMLPLDVDPKLGWALRNRGFFPVDLNRDAKERLLRVPGLGLKTVERLLKIRRWQRVRLEDLVSLRAGVKRAMPFITCAGYVPQRVDTSSETLRAEFAMPAEQLSLAL